MEFILETLGKIGFEWKMALFNLINFLILFWILKKYAFGPVMRVLKERHEKVTESVENITKAKTELQTAEKKAQDIIDNAKVEGSKIVEAAHDDAKEVAEELKKKAKADIELLISQAKRNIEIDKQEMKEELRKETVALVITATEKLIGKKFDAKKDEKFIQSIIKSMK